jgi:RNA polymerase sigma-70 factor (ECF subfamily)
LVHAKIGELPESYRIILQLRDIEELTTKEVADALGLSETNIKVRLHRARSALKKLLEPILKGEV